MIVDDEAGILHAAERILGPRAEVRSSRVPAEALDLAAEFRPELAILDVRMPQMDGFELLARLKAVHADIDVILMTGSVNETDAKLARAIREKAFFFLQKPFEREVLLTLFERWHELRHLAEENRRHLRRLQQDLRDAAAFQSGMLPPEHAEISGVALDRRYLPCEDLGGDLVDFAPAGDGACRAPCSPASSSRRSSRRTSRTTRRPRWSSACTPGSAPPTTIASSRCSARASTPRAAPSST
jgi:CheY-like chemotaxis protein